MANIKQPEKLKVTLRLKDTCSESVIATKRPELLDGWMVIEAANGTVHIPESQIIRYSITKCESSPALNTDPNNGQYSGMHPSVASALASTLARTAAESGQTEQLYKHLSVLLPIMQTAKSND